MVSRPSPHGRARRLRRPAVIGVALTVVLWLLAPGVASAHAHLVQADPAPGSVIGRAPATASFLFDESLNPTLTRVRITTTSGMQVANGGHLVPRHNGELWRLAVPPLRAGTYSVFWTSESATDGHVMSSFYTFRVASSGAADSAGAVTGVMAGMGGQMADSSPPIDGMIVAMTFFIWVSLMAQALWLGALVVELAVLAPARRAAGTPQARLAWAAAPRLWWMARRAPLVILAALAGQVVIVALEGTGGAWGQALAPATLGGVLSSQNGNLIVLRIVILFVTLRLTQRVRVPSSAGMSVSEWPRMWPAPQPIGIIAPPLTVPHVDWATVRLPVTILAAIYALVVAVSGHAANVAPALFWQSCAIDWLHLLCTAAWAGGMAALAYGVMSVRSALAPRERARAVLPVLDRFGPVAYAAVGVLALSGLYSAAHHLDSAAMLSSTTYGQLLMLKLGLVGLLVILSASHVFGLRPRIARAQYRASAGAYADNGAQDMATVHEGMATLAARLRLEAWVGAAILLATALMSQTLPAQAAAPTTRVPRHESPTSITGMAATGDLVGRLTIAPATVGTADFTLRLWEHGRPITENTGAAILHVFPLAQPALRAALTPSGHGSRFAARGSLAAAGTWRADVLARTAVVNDYRTLRFVFTVGRSAHFVAPRHTSPAPTRAHRAARDGSAMPGM